MLATKLSASPGGPTGAWGSSNYSRPGRLSSASNTGPAKSSAAPSRRDLAKPLQALASAFQNAHYQPAAKIAWHFSGSVGSGRRVPAGARGLRMQVRRRLARRRAVSSRSPVPAYDGRRAVPPARGVLRAECPRAWSPQSRRRAGVVAEALWLVAAVPAARGLCALFGGVAAPARGRRPVAAFTRRRAGARSMVFTSPRSRRRAGDGRRGRRAVPAASG